MNQNLRGYSLKRSVELLLLAFVYCALILILHTITGYRQVDGTLGIVLGLFICSHPTGNVLDLLIYKRNILQPNGWSWAINFLVLLIGWMVIFLGATQYIIGAHG